MLLWCQVPVSGTVDVHAEAVTTPVTMPGDVVYQMPLLGWTQMGAGGLRASNGEVKGAGARRGLEWEAVSLGNRARADTGQIKDLKSKTAQTLTQA